jgi:3-hydroxymyristoyl/3-hydroxydecanoyl-(acyl carrier protein) dehydratase
MTAESACPAPTMLGIPLSLCGIEDSTGRVTVELTLDPAWQVFAEHFPGDPVLPGSATLHLMIRTAALLAPGARLGSIAHVRFGAALRPGARLRLVAIGGAHCSVRVHIGDDRRPAAQAEVRHDPV